MDSFIKQYKNQFSHELSNKLMNIIDIAVEKGITRKGGSGKNTLDVMAKDSIDLDLTHDMEIDEVNKDLFRELQSRLYGPISDYVNNYIINRQGLKNYASDAEVVKTFILLQPPKLKLYKAPDQGYHAWHQDWGLLPVQARRLLVAMVYLNDVSEGGETAFYHQDLKIKPEKGKMVIFPPYFTHMHKGMKPISNDKYICNFYIGVSNPA